jgi:hypothetical protein
LAAVEDAVARLYRLGAPARDGAAWSGVNTGLRDVSLINKALREQ